MLKNKDIKGLSIKILSSQKEKKIIKILTKECNKIIIGTTSIM